MRKYLSAAAAALLLTSLAGCIDPGPAKTPVPTPSATPVFASDEEALAAAEAAYAAYLAVSDAIAQEGGANADRLSPLVTPEWLDHELTAFEKFQAVGNRQTGSTALIDAQLQRIEPLAKGAEVVIYACVDFSGTSFIDPNNSPIEPTGPRTATLEVTFEGMTSNQLLLSRSEPWVPSIC